MIIEEMVTRKTKKDQPVPLAGTRADRKNKKINTKTAHFTHVLLC